MVGPSRHQHREGPFRGPAIGVAVIYRIDSTKFEEELIVSRVMNRVACAGAAVLVLCGVLACTTPSAKSDAQRQADRETARSVQAALDADKKLYAKHITVRADNGVVRLSGYVWDPPDLIEAKRVAALVPGVSQVVNDLELERNGSDNSGITR
jgi:BON domain